MQKPRHYGVLSIQNLIRVENVGVHPILDALDIAFRLRERTKDVAVRNKHLS
jgi:hypothetical protein